jgi:16S rRNA (guanine527-N7)-methyltransferase
MIHRLAEVTGHTSMLTRLQDVLRVDVSRETFASLERYVTLLIAANSEQNLVAASTIDDVWERHIIDSAQLVRFEPRASASWIDIGSGSGLPGIVVAILTDGPVTLVEPRRLRVDFLHFVIDELGLSARVRVVHGKADKANGKYDVITARAVASTDRLLAMTLHLSHRRTVWLLPKGRSGKSDLAEATRTWQGAFRSEISLTDPDAIIVVASGIHAKGRR